MIFAAVVAGRIIPGKRCPVIWIILYHTAGIHNAGGI
jgi:hypothetical protein